MKMTVGFLFTVFMCANSQAAIWPPLDFVGQCVSEDGPDRHATFKFYSEKMQPELTVNGFVSVTLQQGQKTQEFGAYPATFMLSTDESKMTVTSAKEVLVIPFGKNVTVLDSNGKSSVCTAKFH